MTINNVSHPGRRGGVNKGPPLDLAESVAGEEDPGASVDLALAAGPGRSNRPGARCDNAGKDSQAPMGPSGETLLGTPESGQEACPRCGGSGTLAGRECPECQGSGKVNVGIGGV